MQHAARVKTEGWKPIDSVSADLVCCSHPQAIELTAPTIRKLKDLQNQIQQLSKFGSMVSIPQKLQLNVAKIDHQAVLAYLDNLFGYFRYEGVATERDHFV